MLGNSFNIACSVPQRWPGGTSTKNKDNYNCVQTTPRDAWNKYVNTSCEDRIHWSRAEMMLELKAQQANTNLGGKLPQEKDPMESRVWGWEDNVRKWTIQKRLTGQNSMNRAWEALGYNDKAKSLDYCLKKEDNWLIKGMKSVFNETIEEKYLYLDVRPG